MAKAQTWWYVIIYNSIINLLRKQYISDDFLSIQCINLEYNICTGIRLGYVPNSKEFLLACGLNNSEIQLYSQKCVHDIQFQMSAQLSKHDDWVRGLAFKQVGKLFLFFFCQTGVIEIYSCEGNDLMLASSSQDGYIRLWRMTPVENCSEGYPAQKNQLKMGDRTYNIRLESVLAGNYYCSYQEKYHFVRLHYHSYFFKVTTVGCILWIGIQKVCKFCQPRSIKV